MFALNQIHSLVRDRIELGSHRWVGFWRVQNQVELEINQVFFAARLFARDLAWDLDDRINA